MKKSPSNPGSIGHSRGGRADWMLWLVGRGCVHATGLVMTTCLVAWLAVGLDHLQWLVSVHQVWGETSMFAGELVVHLALSALLWSLIFMTGCGVTTTRHGPRTVRPVRGTAITETLVVIPVLLLLILGTAQLAINNIARVLLNYGTSQAVRAAWVWQPEVEPLDNADARMGVSQERVEEMVRLRVAAAMTPVAPAMFASERSIDTESFQQMRAIFLATQMEHPPLDAGGQVVGTAEVLDTFDASDELTFRNALDGGSYPQRTVRKFTSAYQATDVVIVEETINEDDFVGVEIEYMHQITFPLVGSIFGERATVGQTQSRFMAMERESRYRAQRPPNAELPRQ